MDDWGSSIGGSVGCDEDRPCALGVWCGGRGDEAGLESLDWVFEEAREDRRFPCAKDVGVGDAWPLPGVSVPGEARPFMSSVNCVAFAAPFSLRDEPFPMRNRDFQDGEPDAGEVGVPGTPPL